MPRFAFAPLALLALAGCSHSDAVIPDPPVDYDGIETPAFTADVLPLLSARCAECHGGDDPAGGLDVTSWASLIAGSEHGEALIAFDPERSLMLEMAAKLPEGHVLRDAHALPQAEVDFLARWIQQGAKNDAGAVPYADSPNLLYVCNQAAGLVSVIDTDARVVIRTVDLADFGLTGLGTTGPHHVVVEPDGSAWYVAVIAGNTVLKFDRENSLLARLDDAGEYVAPGMLALDRSTASDVLVAGHSFAFAFPGESAVALIDRRTMAFEEVAVGHARPHALAVSNDGAWAFSGSLADNVLASIRLADREVFARQPVGAPGAPVKTLVHFAPSPTDPGLLTATGQISGELLFLDVSDPENVETAGAVVTGNQPWHHIFSPDGATVYVPNRISHDVAFVDVASRSVTARVSDARFSMPHGSAVTDGGATLWVSNRNLAGPDGARRYQPRYPFVDAAGEPLNADVGHVAVIDVATREVVRVLELEGYPSGMGRAE